LNTEEGKTLLRLWKEAYSGSTSTTQPTTTAAKTTTAKRTTTTAQTTRATTTTTAATTMATMTTSDARLGDLFCEQNYNCTSYEEYSYNGCTKYYQSSDPDCHLYCQLDACK